MNDAYTPKPSFAGLVQVFHDNCFNLSRLNRMQIKDVSDFDFDRIWKRIVQIELVILLLWGRFLSEGFEPLQEFHIE